MLVRSNRRPLVWIGLLLCAIALVAPPGAGRARAASGRPVMAFYYPWYEMGDWTYDKMSDIAAPKYSGGDDKAMLRHIQQADDAGIDALICTWYGPNEDRLNKRCRRLLELVQESGRAIKVGTSLSRSRSLTARNCWARCFCAPNFTANTSTWSGFMRGF